MFKTKYNIEVGERFNKLVIIKNLERKKGSRIFYECLCDCGKTTRVQKYNLIYGHTKSCGCLMNQIPRTASRKPVGESAFNYLLHSYTKSAQKRGYQWSLSIEEFKNFTKMNCFYCGVEPKTVCKRKHKGITKEWEELNVYVYNGIDRLDNSIGYILSNCVPCCKVCNIIKRCAHIDEFKNHIEKIYTNLNFYDKLFVRYSNEFDPLGLTKRVDVK